MTRPTHAGPIIGGVLLAFLAVGMAGWEWLRRIELASVRWNEECDQ